MLHEEIERPYVRLTAEEKSRLNLSYQRLLQEGLRRPKLGRSLLGFDWSFPGSCLRNPGEFLLFRLRPWTHRQPPSWLRASSTAPWAKWHSAAS
jgi:hypothetical protein